MTLRLPSTMYHRFHAPHDCEISETTHIPGDAWNVNPAAVNRDPRLYCRNERAVVHMRLRHSSDALALVAVGAILVASIHLNFLDLSLGATYGGPRRIKCRALFPKGAELGYFHHGSTIIVLAPGRFERCDRVGSVRSSAWDSRCCATREYDEAW